MKRPIGVTLQREIMARQDGKCAYCHINIENPAHSHDRASLDHIVPQSRGGTDGLDNLQFLYVQCNSKKGNLSHEMFMERRQILGTGYRKDYLQERPKHRKKMSREAIARRIERNKQRRVEEEKASLERLRKGPSPDDRIQICMGDDGVLEIIDKNYREPEPKVTVLPDDTPTDDYLDEHEAARYLGIDLNYLHNSKNCGAIAYHTIKGQAYFSMTDLDHWLSRRF